ncbi:hypothetical protein [Bifidobacterium castoris]|uniref:Oligoribonuclease n=1 Tax=Bifidobacterium castoris TaxID=2306972 RepID=A0A430F4I1_9BIFI|nr:hypothetical protein [Bifidobacterium castoris]RSX44673.1 oligoribonuclease [Bifidobacterium castoris]
MSANNEHLLLWIDTETTAIKPEDGQLLEIGMRITDLDGTPMTEPGNYDSYKFSTVIPHSCINYTRDTAYAIRMHQDNGLLDEALCAEPPVNAGEWLLDRVDRLTFGGPSVRLHPAGTNVDFDLAWLRAHQEPLLTGPAWNEYVSYRKLDMSTIRLTLETVGINPYENSRKATHRVDDCLDRDIYDWTHWAEWAKKHMNIMERKKWEKWEKEA